MRNRNDSRSGEIVNGLDERNSSDNDGNGQATNTNTINNTIYNQTAVPRLPSTSGSVPKTDIARLRQHYVPRTIDSRLRDLRDLIVISGPPGTGRESAAIVSLAQQHEHVKVIVPARDFDDLTDFLYEPDTGYILDFTSRDDGADFARRHRNVILEDLAKRTNTALILLVDESGTDYAEGPWFVRWQRITNSELIEALLPEEYRSHHDRILESISQWDSVGNVVDLLLRVRNVPPQTESIEPILDAKGANRRQIVERWFTQERSSRETALVMTLCFLGGVPHETFGTALSELDGLLPPRPATDVRAPPVPWRASLSELGATFRVRKRRIRNSVLEVEVVEFETQITGPESLACAWRSVEPSDRAAIVQWLKQLPGTLTELDQITDAIASLMQVGPESALGIWDAWTRRGDHYSPAAAAFTIEKMALRNDLRPLAFRLVNDLPKQQLATAVVSALCWGTALGLYEPATAIHNLRSLLNDPRTHHVCLDAFGRLGVLSSLNPREGAGLLRAIGRHRSFEHGRYDDALFTLINVWMKRTEGDLPPIVRLAASSSENERLVTALIVSVQLYTNAFFSWFDPFLVALDSDPVIVDTSKRVISSSLERLPRERRQSVISNLSFVLNKHLENPKAVKLRGSRLSLRASEVARTLLNNIELEKTNA